MISVSGEWDAYKLDELHSRLEPAYTADHTIINLSGTCHVTDTLLTALLELRNYRQEKKREPAMILVNSAFVRKLLSLAGFDQLSSVYESVELLIPRAA